MGLIEAMGSPTRDGQIVITDKEKTFIEQIKFLLEQLQFTPRLRTQQYEVYGKKGKTTTSYQLWLSQKEARRIP